jgi:transposase InsO family protein
MGGHSMDFITGLPRILHGYHSIWVIVDRLTKSAHFLPINATYPIEKYAELYLTKIVCLHGVSKTIVSDRGLQFTTHFLESLHDAMGTTLTFSAAYHPQTHGQTERVNQILEDMLRACTIIYGKDWETCLPFAEFPTTIAFKQVLGCHLLRLYIDEVVELLSIGRNPKNASTLAQKLSMKLKKK